MRRARAALCGVARAARVALCCVVLACWACGPPPTPARGAGPAAEDARTVEEVDRGRAGSLRQDQISVRMSVGELRIEATPLAAWVLEAVAPDTRIRLQRIAETHGPELSRRSGNPTPALFLVSFTSRQPGTEFQPDDLHMVSRGLRERPAAIRPITPGWGSQRLEQQATAQAVYAYGSAVNLTRDLTVAYRGTETSSWSSRLAAIEAERMRIGRRR